MEGDNTAISYGVVVQAIGGVVDKTTKPIICIHYGNVCVCVFFFRVLCAASARTTHLGRYALQEEFV